jgi:hypothetical protein
VDVTVVDVGVVEDVTVVDVRVDVELAVGSVV